MCNLILGGLMTYKRNFGKGIQIGRLIRELT